MNQTIADLLENIMNAQGISIFYVQPVLEDITKVDFGLRKLLYQDTDSAYRHLLTFLANQARPNTAYFVKDEFQIQYCIYQLPDTDSDSKTFCIIGPLLCYKLSYSEFHTFLNRYHIPEEFSRDVLEFLNRIPTAPSADYWFSFIVPFCHGILGEESSSIYLELPFNRKSPEFSDYHVASSQEASLDALAARYELEERMLSAVRIGNEEKAHEYHHRFLQFKITQRTSDLVRNQKNLLITFNTLLRKAVQDGQVHPLHIDNLSTQFAIQIEESHTASQLDALSSVMIRKYCMLVKNYSRRSYSPLIQTCLDYIDFHYAEDISLDSLSRMCSVTNPYLSSLFRKEVNSTLTDYIHSTRIRQALILLNTTSLSIQEISERCGFGDANYFTRIFRKFQGLSPRQYRDSIH